ncbi:hypothetical protein [Actinomadura sp. NBRC 104412]|uniref:hypothetical protein n=1 Tax=Actinomadura sp. NBRC 104412 TaxID=3032203 RepID=UPI0025528A34|nr:hypothetical protein [Actinomadura sp. NBRC 104412]
MRPTTAAPAPPFRRRSGRAPSFAAVAWTITVVLVVANAALDPPIGRGGPVTLLAAVPAAAVCLLYRMWLRRRFLASYRMRCVHVSAAPRSGPGEEVAVRVDGYRVRLRHGSVPLALFVCGITLPLGYPALMAAYWVAFGVFIVTALAPSFRAAPRLYLRADGLELRRPAVGVPWSAFIEIRVAPSHGAWLTRKGRQAVVFVAADAEELISGLRPFRVRWRARSALKAFGGPLVVEDFELDRSAGEIATAASALSGLPVRSCARPGP